MLQNQLAKGNNGLIKTKYLTFGIDADNIRAAKPRLERIETDILNNFKRLGVSAEVLNGMARLAAPLIVLLTLFVWTCVALVYVSGLVLGLVSMVIALLGVAVLVTYSPQNGLILLLIAFLISPYGLPKLAFWMLGKVQGLKYTIQDWVYG